MTVRAIPYKSAAERDKLLADLASPWRLLADHRNLDGSDELHITDDPPPAADPVDVLVADVAAASTVAAVKAALVKGLPAALGRRR